MSGTWHFFTDQWQIVEAQEALMHGRRRVGLIGTDDLIMRWLSGGVRRVQARVPVEPERAVACYTTTST